MNITNQRLECLREVMKREHLAAFIFPSTDAHQSEYVADHWMGRAWISGFNGSAGTAVVTMHSAALWTDSRYFLAAEEQLQGTEFQLMKLKIPGTPSIAEWLGKELMDVDSPEVGLDGWVNSYSSTCGLIADLRKAGGITVRTNFDPLEEIWKDRPSIPLKPVEIQPMEYAGEDISSKIVRIRKALRAQHADGMLVSALDDIAWTLNLRGTDVHCVPVFVSYLLIASDKVSLFVDETKISSEVRAYLESNGVSIYKYNKVEEGLKAYSEYQAHGAIVHYEATPETDIPLKPEGLLLLDSGAQYQDGTTDITRTIALGPITEEMKHIYTLVLKAHIQLELAKFPDGASGTQLDALGRECMWREGLNFLHGTGHGVGSYLSVHEGPHQIRMEYMPTPLRAGMTLTDEPGLYLAGKFGVRIENTVLLSEYMETEFGKFLQIEPLTLCPIDTAPVDMTMLLPEELAWLNDYHAKVYAELAPYLDEEEKKWLENATKAIK